MKYKNFDIENEILIYLKNHTAIELFKLNEKMIERKAKQDTKEWWIKCFNRMQSHKNLPSNFFEQTQFKDIGIFKMENKCNALKKLIKKNKLNHQERTALLFLYIPFKEKGEKRLHQILSLLSNYKFHTTKIQIDSYKKKKQLYGLSCKKLQEWGICNEQC